MFTLLFKVLKWIFSWFVKHPRKALVGAGVLSLGAAATGGVKAHKAKKINKKAQAIQQAALEKHEKAYHALMQDLDKLGQTEKNAIDSFCLFAETIEKIQERPNIKSPLLSRVKLPNYEPEEFIQLSSGVQTAMETVVGAGTGALAGLAAFGASAVVAAPAMIGAGVVLCVRGFGLKKKAIENKKQAEKMSESVDEIVDFYSRLRTTANTYSDSVSSVYNKYMECMSKILVTLTRKTSWKEFSREEKKNVENTVLLARLLYQMCQTNLIIKHEDTERIEEINAVEIQKLQKNAQRELAHCR